MNLKLPSQTFPRNDGKSAMPKPKKGTVTTEKRKKSAEVKARVDAATKETARNDAPIPAGVDSFVRERDNDTCKKCGLMLGEVRLDGSVVKSIQIHHILARARGGSNDERNLECRCDKCNVGQGARRDFNAERRARKEHLPESDKIVEKLAKLVKKRKT